MVSRVPYNKGATTHSEKRLRKAIGESQNRESSLFKMFITIRALTNFELLSIIHIVFISN